MDSFEEWEAEYRKYIGGYRTEPVKKEMPAKWRFDLGFIHGLPTETTSSRIDRIERTQRDIRRDGAENIYLCLLTHGAMGEVWIS